METKTLRFSFLFLFAMAMAYLEATVVIYLRLLYFPQGFTPEMSDMPLEILKIEWLREIATIIMLFSVAFLSFKRLFHKFLIFLWIFAIWDLFYYLFLYLILKWPPSLNTIDVLFLIPVPWVAPVWFPVMISSLAFISISIYFLKQKGGR